MVGRRGGRGTHTFLSPEVQDGIKKKQNLLKNDGFGIKIHNYLLPSFHLSKILS